MNNKLLSKKPKEVSSEEFIKSWENIGYTLQALHSLLQELVETNNKIKKDDFDSTNHYAKLAFQSGENKAYEFIMSLLPHSSKP
jgi:hypothetical protein